MQVMLAEELTITLLTADTMASAAFFLYAALLQADTSAEERR